VQILRFDHIVITLPTSSARVASTSGCWHAGRHVRWRRKALAFGEQKINLHQRGKEFEPKAHAPTPGSADLCFITATPVTDVLVHLEACGVAVLEVQ